MGLRVKVSDGIVFMLRDKRRIGSNCTQICTLQYSERITYFNEKENYISS